MLSIATAQALRAAGLVWEPTEFDTFVIPDHDLDESQFVINEMPAHVARLQDRPVMTFGGAAEWALDYIAAGDVVWLPSEEQLRLQLAARLAADPDYRLTLSTSDGACRCTTLTNGQSQIYEAADASEAYAAALLAVLQSAD